MSPEMMRQVGRMRGAGQDGLGRDSTSGDEKNEPARTAKSAAKQHD